MFAVKCVKSPVASNVVTLRNRMTKITKRSQLSVHYFGQCKSVYENNEHCKKYALLGNLHTVSLRAHKFLKKHNQNC